MRASIRARGQASHPVDKIHPFLYLIFLRPYIYIYNIHESNIMYLLIDNFVLNAGAQPLRQKLNFSRVKEEGGQRRVGGRTRLLSN